MLPYTDETDRAYGATGMAIGLMIYDGDDLLYAIDLDAPASDGDPAATGMMVLSPDFYFAGNPGVSARSAWHQMLKNYNLGVSMIVANLLCRHLVHQHRALPQSLADELRSMAREEGAGCCSLDSDEADRVFDKCYDYLTRVFSHRGVQAVAHDFASALTSRRHLSRLDALDLLEALRML